MTSTVNIKIALEADFDDIWEIFKSILSDARTYAFSPDTTRTEAHAIWMSESVTTYVACIAGDVVGAYWLKPNQPGLGSHVANAAYVVKDELQGAGIGRAMCEHSIAEARRSGFLAMQFNMVVSSNTSAVALWKKMGFSIVGTVPKAFRHRELGLVDVYIMHRFL